MSAKDELDEKRMLFHDVRAKLQLLDPHESILLNGINPVTETKRLDILFSNHAKAVEAFLETDDRQTRFALRETSAALYHCVKWLTKQMEHSDDSDSFKDFKIWMLKWANELPEDEQ